MEQSGTEALDGEDDFEAFDKTVGAGEDGDAGGGGEEMEEEFEKSDSITGMSAADKKKHQLEYLQLLKEIEGQNQIVEQLKDQLIKMCEAPCLTKCELREIKKLRGCMENENLKLQCMVQKAIQMQNENPSRCWDEVPIVTTIEDDVFPKMGNSGVMASLGLMPRDKAPEQRDICDVCAKRKKAKPCKPPCPGSDELDSDTCKLFEEIALKDKLINCLNEKLAIIQQELCVQKAEKKRKSDRPRPCPCPMPCPMEVECNIAQMQCTVERLKHELKSLCREKQAFEKKSRKQPCGGDPCGGDDDDTKKPNELRKLKQDYAELLVCFAKKDEQLKDLEARSKGYCGGGGGGGKENVDMAELKLLREKVNDLRDEQDEYTCIIKEQAEQLDDYRRKYLDAQQKVEEQKCMLEKIDMNNKRIEGQIEAEVKRIKAKFKEQLSELSQYPKLLENEQIKLATACKDREELENKLRLVCKELKLVKEQLNAKDAKPDLSGQLAKTEHELTLLQHKMEEVQKEKDIVCEELLRAKLDLDTMRAESAKIITSTKERFEMNKNTMCCRIDSLEKELAQCRANAYLSITDREAVIKEMQSQLSTLSYSFDSAQKQIKTLKNHITFLSNDQCIPIKC